MTDIQPVAARAKMRACATTRYRNSELQLHHLVHDGDYAVSSGGLPPEDTYVALIQLRDLPSHDYWLGGRHFHQPAGGSRGLNIFHLSDEPACRITETANNLHLYIPRAALDDLADDAESPRIDHLRTQDGWEAHDGVVEGLKQSLLASFERHGSASNLFLDHTILALHAHLASVYGGMQPKGRRHSGGLAPWQERRAKELMADNLHMDVSLSEIAQACNLSTSHFARAFKVSTGTTPYTWLQARRVDRARALLDDYEMSLAEIALACGFADQSHFTRVFASIAGTTPGAWRRYRTAA